jgi:hypothetical protein
MKRLALPLALAAAAAALAGCADPAYVSYGYGPAYNYQGAWDAWDRPFVATAPVFIEGRGGHRFDRDRDRDGIPDRFDTHPYNPHRG